jgi:serine/threonine protein kinase
MRMALAFSTEIWPRLLRRPLRMSDAGSAPLTAWLKKKGTRFGFWHRRFCALHDACLTIARDSGPANVERTIYITPATRVDLIEDDKQPRFVVSSGSARPVCLSHESAPLVRAFVHAIRNVTLTTPGMSMDRFEIVSVLGRGFYGKVMLCRCRDTDSCFAIKAVHKSRLLKSNQTHTIFSERDVLMKCRHPFIVDFAFAFQTDAKLYLGLEYVPGGELFQYLRRRRILPIAEVRLYVAELALALNHLHALGVVYRDLKPENLLLDAQGHIKLTDLGLVKELTTDSTSTFCGTTEYLAPEIVARRPYGRKVDWWALGVLTYELLIGFTPFHRQNKVRMYEAITSEQPRFRGAFPEHAKSFILMLLEKDPDARADFERVRAHPFLDGMDFEEVLARQVKPAFVPSLECVGLENFDRQFTAETAVDSFATPISHATDDFKGFSHVGEVAEDNGLSSDGEEERGLEPSRLE